MLYTIKNKYKLKIEIMTYIYKTKKGLNKETFKNGFQTLVQNGKQMYQYQFNSIQLKFYEMQLIALLEKRGINYKINK